MKYTTNKNLKLPDYTDVVDVQNFNDNFTTVDSHMGEAIVSDTGAHGFRYNRSSNTFEYYNSASSSWVSVSNSFRLDNVLTFIDGTSINDLNDCINRGIYLFVDGGAVPQHCPFNGRTFFLIVLENGSGELSQPTISQIGIMYDVHGAQIQKRSSYFGEFGMWE